MSRQTILISSLGESPAVVTEAIDKLEMEERIQFTQVITLGTKQSIVHQGEEILSKHIPVRYGDRITYIPDSVESLDVLTEQDNLDYLTKVAEWLRAFPASENDVYVSLAGGRKTMSALMALAVQIYGAKLMCHVVHKMMDEHLQHKMEAGYLQRYPEEQDELLHPAPEELELVRFPVISLYSMLDDLLAALGGTRPNPENREVLRLLQSSGLVEKDGDLWNATGAGKKLLNLLREIESLPASSSIEPRKKDVALKEHHGRDKLKPVAEKLRNFPYAVRIASTDMNSQFDRKRMMGLRFMVELNPDKHDVLTVRIESREGLALDVYTNAATENEAKRVKIELEEFLRNRI